jgi:predicted AlkP superfamily pyrophosphatase or phosphodiesterase
VVVIGVDGLSPDGILHADTPAMDQLMANGAFTMRARAVLPTSSSPNWASMIMGADPIHHGITSNDWELDDHELSPVVSENSGRYPTIFAELRKQHPQKVQACLYDWDGFGRLVNEADFDRIEDCDGPRAAAEAACDSIRNAKPTLLFVHLDHVDHAGHDHGHGTPEYYESVRRADTYIGQILASLDEAGIRSRTVVLVTSDHGGKGKGHGGASRAEVEIPWILQGPGVRKGREIAQPVFTYDTAATVAHLLGVSAPACWIGKPVVDALEQKSG